MPISLIVVGAGVLMTAISGFSLWRCIQHGGVFINQLRFLVSGLLLVFFFPLQDLSTDFILKNISELGAGEDSFTLAYWASIAVHVTVQIIILPTQREMYSTYMADQMARATSTANRFHATSQQQVRAQAAPAPADTDRQ